MDYSKLLIIMTIIFSAIILFTCIGEFIKKKFNLMAEDIIIYILYLIFLAAQYILSFQIKPIIILLVITTFIGNSLIGNYFNIYNTSKYYDRYLHAFGSFSFSLFFYSIIYKLTMESISSKSYVAIFVTTIGISLGCIFEIYEFISDSTINSHNQHGLKDTNFDLISNIIGSTIAGIISISIF